MKRIILYILAIVSVIACADDEDFSTSSSDRLSMSVDTLLMDTVFAQVGSSTYTVWVYNCGDKALRLTSVKLKSGNQTGFRVNVDGEYLDNQLGSVVTDLELRSGDSLRVFVELTSPATRKDEPQEVSDDLLFTLESGVVQALHMKAWAWDALKMTDKVISRDTVIDSPNTPIIIYGSGLRVDSGAVLTIRNTTLYFHDGAGIDVYGTLKTENSTMRGDRLDRMFDYLPYDRISGQWRGLWFAPSSTSNELSDTEIRNAMTGVHLADSAVCDSTKPRLVMTHCVVHNMKGYGVISYNSNIRLEYCQITNTWGDCLAVYGGSCLIDHCTLAQFYPFAADRGAALRFVSNDSVRLKCSQSLLTGYASDVLMGEQKDTAAVMDYEFSDCLLRTPRVDDDTIRFRNIIWETDKDSIQGKQHFVAIDEDNLYYDFHLDSLSTAKGMGCYGASLKDNG